MNQKGTKPHKNRKIGKILIIIFIFLIVSLFMPFSFAPKPSTGSLNYEYVMRDAFESKDPLVTKIGMLGAHDAFTSDIGYVSKPDTNESGFTTNKVVGTVAKGLVVRMSKAQNANAKELLYSGVRYLDVRISKIDGVYYTIHAYISNTLKYYLQDVVDFLDTHPGELIVFDIQHFYTENGSNFELKKSDYSDLTDFLKTVHAASGKSLLDFVYYDQTVDKISSLTYTKVTNNRTSGGVIILAKTSDFPSIYPRDNDASYTNTSYQTIRSLWHNVNSTNSMRKGIEAEYEYLKENPEISAGIFVVNQAQKTGFVMNVSIIHSLFSWSILDMANNFNKTLVYEKDDFIRWLSEMPIVMVDNATSARGEFNILANKYILEYNSQL